MCSVGEYMTAELTKICSIASGIFGRQICNVHRERKEHNVNEYRM